MSLEDDIARVAALRGHTPDQLAQARRATYRVGWDDVFGIFRHAYGPDFPVFDELPDDSRAFLMTLPLYPDAASYWRLVERIGERQAIAAVRHFLPDVCARWLSDHYKPAPGGMPHPGPCKDPTCQRRPRVAQTAW